MNRQELFALHATLCAKGLEIMKAKNQDYAGKGGDDPFANFSRSEVLGIPRELGLMLRVMDKFCRIKSFIESGTLAVKGEPVDDAILDIINYMVLLQGMVQEKRGADAYGKELLKRAADEGAESVLKQAYDKWDRAIRVPDQDETTASERLGGGNCLHCGLFVGPAGHFCVGPAHLRATYHTEGHA